MISIVTGGAYGDEGKGKVVAYLSKRIGDIVIRAGGGPQAGHHIDKDRFVCQVPSGLANEKAILGIARGTVINPSIVLAEIEKYALHDRIFIDPGCTIIENDDIEEEKDLVKRIGSVGTGVGPARVRRIMRSAKIAKDVPELKRYLARMTDIIREGRFKDVLIEGVQGYGLDLLDADYYPFVTSQSTIASQFAADVGIGPRSITNVYTCFKAYVTRVGAGRLFEEWDEEKRKMYGIDERGTISGRLRRIGNFDIEMAKLSIEANSANIIIINCLDRLFPTCKGLKKAEDVHIFAPNALSFVHKIVRELKFEGSVLVGTGEDYENIVNLGILR